METNMPEEASKGQESVNQIAQMQLEDTKATEAE